jgi:hypothetical protein
VYRPVVLQHVPQNLQGQGGGAVSEGWLTSTCFLNKSIPAELNVN